MTKSIPYAWQLQAAAEGAVRKIISLAVDCSCGKTLAVILIAIKKQMPTIVIAPTHSLCAQWKNDLIEELGDEADVWVYSRSEEVKQGERYKEKFMAWLQQDSKHGG
jgi:superfamily II DNA or RNA helicase